MKARDIKQDMLKRYEQEINNWEQEIMRLEATEIRIRNLEANLNNYFGVKRKKNFEYAGVV